MRTDPRRVVVLANRTLGSAPLLALLEERRRTSDASFHLVVPATPVSGPHEALVASEHLPSFVGEPAGFAVARSRLDHALEALRAQGYDVTGEVGDPDAFVAAREALTALRADELVVATAPSAHPGWWPEGIVRHLEHACDVTITHLVATG